jgi:Methyltransferase FkbM domain
VDDGAGALGRTEVDSYSVDRLAEIYGRPDVLFTDVEGYECQVLQGARETLSGKPDCFVEVHVGKGLEKFGGSVDQVVGYFPSGDYELLVSRPHGGGFCSLEQGSDILEERFLLLALATTLTEVV